MSASIGRISTEPRSSVFDKVDGAAATSFTSVSDPWRRTYGEGSSDGFGSFNEQRRQEDSPQNQFTPLVKIQAASFPASEATQDSQFSSSIFIADLMRGLGVYELNMKVCQGVFRNQGSVINRYS
ncbi:MAG TPA: hypothetical protein VM661_11130 [Candidatus Sulfotelmatobacter sp.]|nr:hypothetical protein [Candidatus Sulfotelmatobacter sp.]